MRALLVNSELSARSIRRILLADVSADLFQFEPDGGYRVTAGPEVFADEVSFLATEPGHSNGALAFQKPDHRRHRVLWWNRDAHMHVVRHQVPLDNLPLLLPGQRVENQTQLLTGLAEATEMLAAVNPLKLSFTADGIHTQEKSGASNFVPWSNFDGFREGRTVILLRGAGKPQYRVIPKDTVSIVNLEQIRSAVRSHLPELP